MGKDPDTTTVTPDMYDTVEDDVVERDPLSSLPGLPRPRPSKVWKCRVCGYSPVDDKGKKCYNCGRAWSGEPGTVPDAIDKPIRPQVRSDGVT